MSDARVDRPISVVIPHYGDPALALALVEDLAGQTGDLIREIIVCDDHSPTPFPATTPGVRVIRREVNGGFGAAVNSGCALATGEYLLLLNSDVRLSACFIERFFRASLPHMPALTGPAYDEEWSMVQSPAGRFPTPLNTSFPRLRVFQRLRTRSWALRLAGMDLRARPGRTASVDWLVGAVLFLPRESFTMVGGFDETYFMFSEEVDLQRTLHEHGVPSVFLGSLVVTHEGGASTEDPDQLDWRMKSLERYFRKWGGLWRYRAASSIVHLANFGWDVGGKVAGRGNRPIRELTHWLRLTWRPRARP